MLKLLDNLRKKFNFIYKNILTTVKNLLYNYCIRYKLDLTSYKSGTKKYKEKQHRGDMIKEIEKECEQFCYRHADQMNVDKLVDCQLELYTDRDITITDEIIDSCYEIAESYRGRYDR